MGAMGGGMGMGMGMAGVGGDATQINQLIQMREQARCGKDFAQADQIREQLKQMGVEVFDKEKTWKQQSTGLSGIVIGYFGDRPPSDVEINALVIQREKARLRKDFATSDMIRDEMKARGVELYDKDLEWKSSDGRRGKIPTFDMIDKGLVQPGRNMMAGMGAMGGMGGGVSPELQAVLAQLAGTNPAWAGQLAPMLGMGGMGGGAPTSKPKGMPMTGGAVSPEAQQAVNVCKQCVGRALADEEIQFLVQTRENCRQAKDFAGSDTLRAEMKNIGLEVYDKEKVWKTSDGRQGAVPSWS